MPYFSKTSIEKLKTCHNDLQVICNKAIELYDFAVICGYRNKEEQSKAFKGGFSKVNYPLSRHNHLPSNAMDLCPYPIDWKNENRFYELAGIIKTVADYLLTSGKISHKIQWGGDWRTLNKDLPHFELEEIK